MIFEAIHHQLDLYDLTPYMDNNQIVFTCDRGPNILKALKGEFFFVVDRIHH